jgi:hypothetical protein
MKDAISAAERLKNPWEKKTERLYLCTMFAGILWILILFKMGGII